MKMRQQLPRSVRQIMDCDDRVIALLGDIGVWSFHEAAEQYPGRVNNIGILEQAMIGVAAGMAKTGLIPMVHTIAPFIVERAYEQLMLDFGYQKLGGNFISVGASYDYSGLGYTHYCPGDVNLLSVIPNMQIVLPGTAAEFDALLREAYGNGQPTYYRLSEDENRTSFDVRFGKANVIRTGKLATVIAVGPMLEKVLAAAGDLDVTILYYTCVCPFDFETFQQYHRSDLLIICEPYYSGAVMKAIMEHDGCFSGSVRSIGIPKTYITQYGTIDEENRVFGLDSVSMRARIMAALKGQTANGHNDGGFINA